MSLKSFAKWDWSAYPNEAASAASAGGCCPLSCSAASCNRAHVETEGFGDILDAEKRPIDRHTLHEIAHTRDRGL
jgi:hypothetical protein